MLMDWSFAKISKPVLMWAKSRVFEEESIGSFGTWFLKNLCLNLS